MFEQILNNYHEHKLADLKFLLNFLIQKKIFSMPFSFHIKYVIINYVMDFEEEIFLYKRQNNKNAPIKIWFAFPAIEAFALSSLGFLSLFKANLNNIRIY